MRPELLGERAFLIHIDAEDPRRLRERTAGQKARVGWRVGDVTQRHAGPFEQGAHQADATGCANGWNQPIRVKLDTPVPTVNRRKSLARTAWAKRVGVGIGLAEELGQFGGVIYPFLRRQVLEVVSLVGEKAPRVSHLRVGVARAQMVNLQTTGLCHRPQIRQGRSHLAGDRDLLRLEMLRI